MINFKDLKIGNTLYVLNKNNAALNRGVITHVSPSHPDAKMGSMLQQVVDVTATIDGKPITYIAPENTSVTYCNELIITGNKECALSEARSINAECEQYLANIDVVREKEDKIKEVISDLDDAFREKQANDARLTKLESMMQTLLDKLS